MRAFDGPYGVKRGAASCQAVAPRFPSLDECRFYHSQTLPSGEVKGEWDLRACPEAYLGNVDVAARSVLEIGPASGFLSFHMERRGAAVTCVEPPMDYLWDVVPHAGFDGDGWRAAFSERIRGVRNSFWYCHALNRSRVRMFEANPYDMPPELGQYDIGVLACVLLHTRSPFSLLESLARRTTQTMVIVEPYNAELGPEAICRFMPHLGVGQVDTWWQFSPQFFASALGLLGFPKIDLHFHVQKSESWVDPVPMFTVVASRQPSNAD